MNTDDISLRDKHSEQLAIADYAGLMAAVSYVALVSESDATGAIIYVNESFVRMAKYSREELIGHNYRILKSGHQPQALFDDLWKTISIGRTWRGEIKNKAKDGSYYWVDTSIAPIMGESGKPERYIAVDFLITDKKKNEEEIMAQNVDLERGKQAILNVLEDVQAEKNKAQSLAHELEKFKIALDGSSDHVIITDPNGIILYANTGLMNITGFSVEEVIGKKAGTKELWGGMMPQEFYETLWHTIKIDKKPFVGEIHNKRKNGSTYEASSTISPIIHEDGTLAFFIGIERDITKEKEIDRAKTEIVSLASHQLRTPLTAINWYVEMLRGGDAGVLNEKQNEYASEIYTASQRMVKLVNDLLNASRIELGTFIVSPETINMPELMHAVVDDLQPQINAKKIQFTKSFASNLPTITADPKLMQMVLQNLLSNAVKYTPEGGSVTLSIALNEQAHMIVISIADTGYGIPKNQQDKIFTRLFRADNARKQDPDGSGLGLYIIKTIVEKSHGTIEFTSEENKGTTFMVSLPASPESVPTHSSSR